MGPAQKSPRGKEREREKETERKGEREKEINGERERRKVEKLRNISHFRLYTEPFFSSGKSRFRRKCRKRGKMPWVKVDGHWIQCKFLGKYCICIM